MSFDSNNILYQKIGVTISKIALNLLSKNAGDRIPPIAYYEEKYQISRGTVQNAINFLKEAGAIELTSHGHMGTLIEKIDYQILQANCLRQEMLGIMPLPYSLTYEGFATAIYEQLKGYKFNMAYARGAEGRIRLVLSGTCQFAVCSQYAAENAILSGKEIETVLSFGNGSYLSKHVLLMRDKNAEGITNGMRVSYDAASLDQSGITKMLVGKKKVKLVDIRIQETISALADGKIDAGVWNYDDIKDNPQLDWLHVVFLDDEIYDCKFATAVIVIQKGNAELRRFLRKNIMKKRTLAILNDIRNKKQKPYY